MNMKPLNRVPTRLLTLSAALLTITACTTVQPNSQIADAQGRLTAAYNDKETVERGQGALASAKDSLQSAELNWQHRDKEKFNHNLMLGNTYLDIAQTRGQQAKLEKENVRLANLARLTQKDNQLAAQGQMISEQNHQLEDKNKQILSRDDLINRNNIQISEQGHQLDGKNQQISARDDVISANNSKLSEQGQQLDGKNQQISARDNVISDKNSQIAKQDQQLAEAQEQLKDYHLKLSNLGVTMVLQDVSFETGKSQLLSGGVNRLGPLINYLRLSPKTKVRIDGYTDNVGGAAFNQRLSLDRANAVKTILVDAGVAGERISTAGSGLTKPVATNATAAGRQANRRVEITLLKQPAPE